MTERVYQIESPPLQLNRLEGSILQEFLNDPEIMEALVRADENYLHWEDLKYKSWVPQKPGMDKELFWTFLRFHRALGATMTPIKDELGRFFKMNTNNYHRFLHLIDKEMGGNFMGVPGLSEGDKRLFLTRNIIEESIASSQLEGANTSRAVAKQMLLEGRKPIGHSEQMIVNTHRTVLRIERELCKEDLSWGLISELHAMITDQTLPKEKQGILRETLDDKGNKLVIKPWDNKTVAYIAPNKEFVESELPNLIDFANNKETSASVFIHPLIKAIMIHFWIGLLHPFEDGNGRLARILFYWYMLKNDYWAFAYLSLSEKIKKSSKQYARAYIYSEQEQCDLTYFINYNIHKIKLAQRDFQEYTTKKVTENKSSLTLTQREYSFNERQIKLLQYLNRKMEGRTNIDSHMKLYSVTKLTAINDLKDLVQQGFLIKKKNGRNVYYYPSEKIAEIFNFN